MAFLRELVTMPPRQYFIVFLITTVLLILLELELTAHAFKKGGAPIN